MCVCVCFWLACLTTACVSHISLHIYLSYAVSLSLSSPLCLPLAQYAARITNYFLAIRVCVRVCINIFMQICKHLRRILFYKFLPRLPAHRMNAIVLVNALTFVFLISFPYTLTAGYLLYVPVDKVYYDLVGNAGICWVFGIKEMKHAEFDKLLEAYEGK